MPADFTLRPATNDNVIYENVVARNEYRVPADLSGAVVIDIGLHVGAFGYLVLSRGAAELHGFEADSANYAQAVRNLASFGSRACLSNLAVWRSDVAADRLHFWRSTDASNLGGGTLIWDTDGPLVNAVAFDEMIQTVSRSGQRPIDLLKIDCEGAEFPILLTSRRLDRIERIVGEYHELRGDLPRHVRIPGCDQFTVEALTSHLECAGFSVTLEPQAMGKFGALGLFFAEQRRTKRTTARSMIRRLLRRN